MQNSGPIDIDFTKAGQNQKNDVSQVTRSRLAKQRESQLDSKILKHLSTKMNWEMARLMTLTKKQDVSIIKIDSRDNMQAIEELKEGEEVKQSDKSLSQFAQMQRYISDSQLVLNGCRRNPV